MSLVKRHPLITFSVLTYVIAWGLIPFWTFQAGAPFIAVARTSRPRSHSLPFPHRWRRHHREAKELVVLRGRPIGQPLEPALVGHPHSVAFDHHVETFKDVATGGDHAAGIQRQVLRLAFDLAHSVGVASSLLNCGSSSGVGSLTAISSLLPPVLSGVDISLQTT